MFIFSDQGIPRGFKDYEQADASGRSNVCCGTKLITNDLFDYKENIEKDKEPSCNPRSCGFHLMFSNLNLQRKLREGGRVPLQEVSRQKTLKAGTAPAIFCQKTRYIARRKEAEKIGRSVSPKKSKLGVLSNTSQPELNCICSETVALLVTGAYSHFYDKVLIIDCRFEYEFNGGHIVGAVNFPREEDLAKFLIDEVHHQGYGENICLVFHCEFSSHRGPRAYKKIRSLDRKKNEHCYPKLFYPEMYLLEGGYKQFWNTNPDLCEPRGYVEMKDLSFLPEMRLGMRNRTSKSQHRVFSRSCSNIFRELDTRWKDMEIDPPPLKTAR